jgi:Anthrone oxygenase
MLSEYLMVKELALVCAALFTGAAFYINAAEQPARLALDDKAMLTEWRESYGRAFAMQASLALASALFGLLAFWDSGYWGWFVGAIVIFANWPYTLLVILPVNKLLQKHHDEPPGEDMRELVAKWGGLHLVRGIFGLVATVIFMWAIH